MKTKIWIYYDTEGYLKRIYLNENNELIKETYYDERWIDIQQIDEEVSDFSVHEDMDIVYIKNNEVMLAYWEQNSWKNKSIYQFKDQLFNLSELKSYRINEKLNIFVLNRKTIKSAVITHILYDKELIAVNTVCKVNIINDYIKYFEVEYDDQNNIQIVYATKENNETVLMTSDYSEGSWKIPVRLYGIKGKDLKFEVLKYDDNINILNCSREYSTYSIEQVSIDERGEMCYNGIYETLKEVNDIVLLSADNVLYAIWIEAGKVFGSSYIKEKWTDAFELKVNNEKSVLICRFSNFSDSNISAKKVFLQTSPEVRVLIPEMEYMNTIKKENNTEESVSAYERASRREELLHNVSEGFDRKIETLKIKLREKEEGINILKSGYARIIDAKKKADENLETMNGIHQNMLNEFEQFKKQYESVKKEVDMLRQELKLKIVESEAMKTKMDVFIEENNLLKKQLEEEKNKGILSVFRKNRN